MQTRSFEDLPRSWVESPATTWALSLDLVYAFMNGSSTIPLALNRMLLGVVDVLQCNLMVYSFLRRGQHCNLWFMGPPFELSEGDAVSLMQQVGALPEPLWGFRRLRGTLADDQGLVDYVDYVGRWYVREVAVWCLPDVHIQDLSVTLLKPSTGHLAEQL